MPSSDSQIHVKTLVFYNYVATRTLSYELSDFPLKIFYSTIIKRLILCLNNLDALQKRDCGW